MQKLVNGTPEGEAIRGALDSLYLDQGLMINEYELHLPGLCRRELKLNDRNLMGNP